MEFEDLDALDVALLDGLQRNARSTFAELGAIVGLKAPAVHDRVKRLEARGFVRGYAARLDGPKLGLGLVAFISAYTTQEVTYAAFTAAVASLPEIVEVHSVAGEESFVVKAVTRSTQHLDALLSRIKALPGIARTKTTIVLSTPFERGGLSLDAAPEPEPRTTETRVTPPRHLRLAGRAASGAMTAETSDPVGVAEAVPPSGDA